MVTGLLGPLRGARGFTLTELAVTLVIFAVIMIGLLGTWTKAQEAYFVGSETAEVQQNVRTAIDFMVREIRAAGRDITDCAFDYSSSSPLFTGADCLTGAGSKAEQCQTKVGGSYTATGCSGVYAIPHGATLSAVVAGAPGVAPGCPSDAVPGPCAIVIRADRNDNGQIAGITTNDDTGAAAGDENVLYVVTDSSSVCPAGGVCIARLQFGQSGAQSMVAVDIDATLTRFVYFPRPGFNASCPLATSPCMTAFDPADQADADNIGRVQIVVKALQSVAGTPISRTLVTDVYLRNRN